MGANSFLYEMSPSFRGGNNESDRAASPESVPIHLKSSLLWDGRIYRKNSKNWDTLNYYRDCPTNVIVGFYSAILRSKDADRIANRVDTDHICSLRSSLIWVCTVCSDLSVPIFQIITVLLGH